MEVLLEDVFSALDAAEHSHMYDIRKIGTATVATIDKNKNRTEASN